VKKVRYGSRHESLQDFHLLGAKFDRDSPLPPMLQIKEETRQAFSLFSWAIFLYDTRYSSLARELAKLVEDH
jgi:hypothetical protein